MKFELVGRENVERICDRKGNPDCNLIHFMNYIGFLRMYRSVKGLLDRKDYFVEK